jgi:hypothetical protein
MKGEVTTKKQSVLDNKVEIVAVLSFEDFNPRSACGVE